MSICTASRRISGGWLEPLLRNPSSSQETIDGYRFRGLRKFLPGLLRSAHPGRAVSVPSPLVAGLGRGVATSGLPVWTPSSTPSHERRGSSLPLPRHRCSNGCGAPPSRVIEAIKSAKAQNRNGLTETDSFPSAVCSTLKSICFCAVVSPTVTYNNPLQVTVRVARLLEFMSIVSSNL
jgi:hypothetical protein